MDYIYDIVLNFHENYYEFYEWKSTDKIINVKRIPIYKISTKDYLNIKNNYTTIDKQSLPKQNKMFLITNGIEVMGLLLDNFGKVVKKSSLIFEESDEIIEDKDLLKIINIKYKIDKIIKNPNTSRLSKEKSNYIESYLNSIDKEKDEYILKYIYYDIYNEEESDVNKIYNKLLDLSKEDKNKMYQSLKRINLELKR